MEAQNLLFIISDSHQARALSCAGHQFVRTPNIDRLAARGVRGSPSGAFMLRKGRWKYHEYVGYQAELFDLDSDPDETINRVSDPSCAQVVTELQRDLRRIADPARADAQARADQHLLVERYGGRDALARLGVNGATPAP